VIAATAKKAFAKAIEWRVAERYTDVSIHDGSKRYSTHEFALTMAFQDIATTLVLANDNDAELIADEGWRRKFENPTSAERSGEIQWTTATGYYRQRLVSNVNWFTNGREGQT
jgi:hypothetical protein